MAAIKRTDDVKGQRIGNAPQLMDKESYTAGDHGSRDGWGYASVTGIGSYTKRPDPKAPVWRVAWDDSDDPYKADIKQTDFRYTKADAIKLAKEKVSALVARRKGKG